MPNCKHLNVIEDSYGKMYKCDISETELGFHQIKEEYERLYCPKKALPNGECMFIQDTNDLTKCPCFSK